jgi:hypothetical protein
MDHFVGFFEAERLGGGADVTLFVPVGFEVAVHHYRKGVAA